MAKFYEKVQIIWEGRKILEKSSNVFKNMYLVTAKQLEEFLKILWPSQNIWTLIVQTLEYTQLAHLVDMYHSVLIPTNLNPVLTILIKTNPICFSFLKIETFFIPAVVVKHKASQYIYLNSKLFAPSWLVLVHVALPNQPINQFKPVQQSRQQRCKELTVLIQGVPA